MGFSMGAGHQKDQTISLELSAPSLILWERERGWEERSCLCGEASVIISSNNPNIWGVESSRVVNKWRCEETGIPGVIRKAPCPFLHTIPMYLFICILCYILNKPVTVSISRSAGSHSSKLLNPRKGSWQL